jgi:hypothetical protein
VRFETPTLVFLLLVVETHQPNPALGPVSRSLIRFAERFGFIRSSSPGRYVWTVPCPVALEVRSWLRRRVSEFVRAGLGEADPIVLACVGVARAIDAALRRAGGPGEVESSRDITAAP